MLLYSAIPQKGELVMFTEPFLIPSEVIAALAVEEAAPQFLLPGEGMLVDPDPPSLGCLTGKKY